MKVIPSIFLSLLGLMLAGTFTQCKSPESASPEQVRNVIFMIGDGMGVAQVHATMQHLAEPLNLERAQYVGLVKTYSLSHKVTDSAASGTALATGTKTYNGAIGVDSDTTRLVSILERAEEQGYATGLVATYRITHATPAAFISHVENRNMEQKIAEDFLETDLDVFIGGGRNMFEKRDDGRNLSEELKGKGYQMVYSMEELAAVEDGKVAGLLNESHLPTMKDGRGDFLPEATQKALDLLGKASEKGFFIMIEGSQIDGGGHDNDLEKVVLETLDFDRAVKAAFDYADAHPGTLVVVTADHETGGLTTPSGANGGIEYAFSTTGHTGVMVPVYSYGTGAEHFTGVMENTEVPRKMAELLGL